MRALTAAVFASVLGSAVSLTNWKKFFDYPSEASVSGIDDSDWFSQNPIQVPTANDIDKDDETQWYLPPQRIETQSGGDEDKEYRDEYYNNLWAIAAHTGGAGALDWGAFKYFIRLFFGFASKTGMHKDHVEHVKKYADAMRRVAAHAEALSTGAVKSKEDLRFYGKEISWVNDYYGGDRPDIEGVTYTFHEDRLEEWKLGPFNMDPMPSSLMGQLESLQSCGE